MNTTSLPLLQAQPPHGVPTSQPDVSEECPDCGGTFPLRQGSGPCPKCLKLAPCYHNTAEYDDISVSWTIYLFCCGKPYIYSSQFTSQALAAMRPMWHYSSKQHAWAISHWCPDVFRFSLPWDDWCVCVWSAPQPSLANISQPTQECRKDCCCGPR